MQFIIITGATGFVLGGILTLLVVTLLCIAEPGAWHTWIMQIKTRRIIRQIIRSKILNSTLDDLSNGEIDKYIKQYRTKGREVKFKIWRNVK